MKKIFKTVGAILAATMIGTSLAPIAYAEPQEIEENVEKGINVSVVWQDGNNEYNLRPEEIKVNLLANGEIVDTLILNEENNYQIYFTAIEDNVEYTIEQDESYIEKTMGKVVNSSSYSHRQGGIEYTTKIEHEKENFIIKNSLVYSAQPYKIEPGEVVRFFGNVKVAPLILYGWWEDDDNVDNIRPTEVGVTIFVSMYGEEVEVKKIVMTPLTGLAGELTTLQNYDSETGKIYWKTEEELEEIYNNYSTSDLIWCNVYLDGLPVFDDRGQFIPYDFKVDDIPGYTFINNGYRSKYLKGLYPVRMTISQTLSAYISAFGSVTHTPGKLTSLSIHGQKHLDGRGIREGEFTFELREGEEVIEEVVNDENGSFTFSEIQYVEPGDYTYTITEKNTAKGGVEYDSHTEEVTVRVVDNGDDTLSAELITDEDGIVFTNAYNSTGEITILGKKQLTGKDMDTFTFTIKEGDEVKATATNDDSGNFSFNGITYTLDDVGTHTYTITEENDNKPGITYDTHAETVTVEVTDNGDGTLATDVSYDDDGVIFTNTYAANGTATLFGKKVLEGKDMDTFTFTLKEDDDVIDESTNAKDGTFSFKGIDYTLADVGTHTYTITEKNDGKGGIKYDTHTETVTVNVTDNGDGTLKTEIKTDSDGVVFNNSYSASGKATIGGKKSLTGKPMDNFTFILKKGEETVDEATNDGNGNFSFKELSFTLDDVGSHTYTVTEKNDGKGGVDYDTHTETIVVNVSDNGDGTLKVDVKTDNDGVAFNNNYSSSGKINFVGQKNLANKAMETFSFELKEGKDTIETVKNGADGKIAFKTITYTLEDVGEHTYTVTEVNDEKPGIAYDTHTETIKVTVTDNGDGTLTATPVYDADGVVFNNTYSATGKTAISGKKVFNNKAMEDFTFVLKEGDTEIVTVKNSDTGEFTFPEIEYDLKDIGKHTYTITETNDSKPGVTYDEHVETVTVDVTDNGDGTLKAKAKFDEDGVIFTNIYSADGTFTISGVKKLEGKELTDGDFTFVLTDQDGNTKETNVKADGTFEFEPFSFTVDDIGKTFTYKITEKNDEDENVTYDEHTEEIIITVEDNGDGTLKITPVYDEDGVVFVNKYTEPVVETSTEEPTEPIVEETLTSDGDSQEDIPQMVETPQETIYEEFNETTETTTVADTGDQSIMPLIIAGILSTAGIVATSIILKKRKNN